MNNLVQAMVWYFAPAAQIARGTNAFTAMPRIRLWRLLLMHTLPRATVFAGFVWIVFIGNWTAAAILAALMIGLGVAHWLFGRWLMTRLGGGYDAIA
jgi:hypothetical protein